MLKIYHNPRCSKSRAGLSFLEENNLDFEVVDYLKESLTAHDVKKLSEVTGLKPLEMVRTQEEYYKKNLKGKSLTDSEWFAIIAENPKLLQRPIVVKGNVGVFAQPPENIREIL